MGETCLRQDADIEQIGRAKKEIALLADPIKAASEVLNLAGNETRLKIMLLLDIEGKLCPCDLSDILGVSVSSISQHLRKLKDREVVTAKKEGQTIYYSIHSANSGAISAIINGMVRQTISVE